MGVSSKPEQHDHGNSWFLSGTGTFGLLSGLFIGYFLKVLSSYLFGIDTWQAIWILELGSLYYIWTWILHIFAASSFSQLLNNGFLLVVFGRSVERMIGTRKFVVLFVTFGIVGGLIHVLIITSLGYQGGVIGSTHSVLAIIGMALPSNPKITFRSYTIPYLYLIFVFVLAMVSLFSILQGQLDGYVWIIGLLLGISYGGWLKRQDKKLSTIKII